MNAGAARAVISDFGGVLTSPLALSFAAYEKQSGVSIQTLGEAMQRAREAGGGTHPLFELEKGRISEADFLRRLEAQLDGDVKLDGLRHVYFEHLQPNPEMIGAMRALRERRFRMALLTNNVREWEPHWRALLPELDDIFELVVDSAFVGMRKPEREIYELTLERLGDGVEARDCVFIDDIEANVDAARELGMRGVHFVDTDQALAEIERALG